MERELGQEQNLGEWEENYGLALKNELETFERSSSGLEMDCVTIMEQGTRKLGNSVGGNQHLQEARLAP